MLKMFITDQYNGLVACPGAPRRVIMIMIMMITMMMIMITKLMIKIMV